MPKRLISFLKSKVATENRKRLLENFFSLSFLQAAGYVMPLVTIPYLTRVLGAEIFGLLAFAQSFTSYFAIFIDYGFGYSATREISINRGDKDKLCEIFCSVITIKAIFSVVSLMILCFFVFLIAGLRADWAVYLAYFASVVGSSLFQNWFFQGMEEMKYITFINVMCRLFFTLLVFVFVHKRADFLYVPILTAIGSFIAGGVALWITWKEFGIRFFLPNRDMLKHQLQEGWHTFTAITYGGFSFMGNAFLLGLLTRNNAIVGYYSASEKLISAVQRLIEPVSNSLYPFFSKLYVGNISRAKELLGKVLKAVGASAFFVSLTVCILAPVIVRILFGRSFMPSAVALRIMSFSLFFGALNNIANTQGFLAFGYQKALSNIQLAGVVAYLIAFPALVLSYGLIGAAIGMAVPGILVCVINYYVLKRKAII